MKQQTVPPPPHDPTLPKTLIKLDGKTYSLCFDFGAMSAAEEHFVSQGHDVNILTALPVINAHSIRIVFPCALHHFHPDISFEDARAMVGLRTFVPITNAIVSAWKAAMPEETEEKPPQNPPNP